MKKNYLLIFCLLLAAYASGQTTIQTTGYTGNGSGSSSPGTGITFNVKNTTGTAMTLTAVGYSPNTTNPIELWCSSSSLTGTTGAVNATNPAWTLLQAKAASSYTTVATNVIVDQFFSGLTLNIPPNAEFRFAVVTIPSTARYSSAANPSPTVFAGGGVQLVTTNSLWGGSGGISNTGRYYYGSITVEPAVACVAPPNAGTAVADPAVPCSGASVNLSLSNSSWGLTQSYQWQSGPSATGPWASVGTSSNVPERIITAGTAGTTYYRCAVTCGASTMYSVPVSVVVPGLFPGGTYTINSALPTGGSNFQTFAAAANAIKCGTTGSIIFNVTNATYNNDRFVLPHMSTSSATNTVTINGNGATLTYNATSATDRATFHLDGADYITVNNLNIIAANTTNAFAVHLTNDADNNTFSGCTINAGQNVTPTTTGAVIISGGDATAADSKCDSNTFINNTIIGGYYAFTLVGNGTTTPVYGNKVINNTIRDGYLYQTYFSGNNGTIIQGNDICRLNRTTVSTFYGLYMVTCRSVRANANKIHDPCIAALTSTSANYGIYNSGASVAGSENIISNNIVYNFSGNGTLYGIYNTSGGYHRYVYNTINLDYNASASTATYFTYGLYQVTASTGIEFNNNIIKITRTGATGKYCMYFSTATATYTGNRNVLHLNAAAGINNMGFFAGVDQATLAAWQTATSQEAASIGIDPVFTAPATGNLLPTAAGVNNLGLPVTGVTTDILNNTRSVTTPDPGAFEMVVPCTTPTGLAASGITGTGANLSWNTVSGAAGYEYAVNTSATPPTGAGTATTATTYSPPSLTPGTTYYLHVRTNCGSNFSNWATYSFTTLCTAPTGLAATGVTTTGANLSWNAITGVTGFEYAVNTSATPPASGTATTGTTYNPSTLTGATAYYLHVRTQCNATTFSAWTSLPFTTQSAACNAPTGLTATGITLTGATLNWNTVATATGYEYAITTTATPPPAGSPIAVTTYTSSSLTPGTTYYAHVRSQCSPVVFSIWTTITFVTPYPPCNPPNASLSNITTGGATISWPAVNGAVAYEYSITSTSTPPATGGTNTTATSETVAGLIDNTTYYAHVRTNCGAGGFSSWVTIPFATAAYCTAPTAIISSITDSKADVNWNAMSSAVSYEYVVSTNMVPPSNGTATAGLNHNADKLLPDTKYYVHLLCVCATERSNWSTSGFTTKSPTGIKGIGSNGSSIDVYPNPVRNILKVKIDRILSVNDKVLLTDITGKVIAVYVATNNMNIDMSSLTAGVYMLKYTGDSHSSHIKIVKE